MDLFERNGKLWLIERNPGDMYLRECLDCGQHWLDEGMEKDKECWNPDCGSDNTMVKARVIIKEKRGGDVWKST